MFPDDPRTTYTSRIKGVHGEPTTTHQSRAEPHRRCPVRSRRSGNMSRAGVTTHIGHNQEAFDVECAALARALDLASRRKTTPENGSQSSPIRKRPSDDWHQTSWALDSSTPSRYGSTSPHCERRGRVSSSRSDGARPTRV